MPQLNPETFSPQLVWLAITFIALYLLMANVLLPRIGGAIEGRRSRIAGDLDRAEALKSETERAIAAYEAALAEARGKAHAITSEMHVALAAEAAGERARIDAEIGERVASAEERIRAVKEKALLEVEKVATEIAGDIVTRLTGAEITRAEAAAAVAKAQGKHS